MIWYWWIQGRHTPSLFMLQETRDLSLVFRMVIVSRSWVRHFTLMVPVSTQEYNLVLVNYQGSPKKKCLRGLLQWTDGWSLFLVLFLTSSIFLWVLQFYSLHRNQHSRFQFNLVAMDKKSHLVECPMPNFILFVYLLT